MKGKSVLLGVSGGIAAYKSAEILRWLVKSGASVQVVMTDNAQRFITPLTLQTLSGKPVGTDLFDLTLESRIGHIQAARAPDVIILAPATANLIGKMAAGIADDYLTTILLATTAPVLVCPSMNVKMYEHPATRRNIHTLKDLGYYVMDPCSGELACQEEGAGRLPDPADIVESALQLITPPTLKGFNILISAGPTWESFDPARFISNPSSGKMGYAIAVEAVRRGAKVDLVSGPSSLKSPPGVRFTGVRSAREMEAAVMEHSQDAHVIVMAAAVSDYRPIEESQEKIKKIGDDLVITLTRNPDILAKLGNRKPPGQLLIGFAAETEDLIRNAEEKLKRKNLDMIVANSIVTPGAGFGTDTNQVTILAADGSISEVPMQAKTEIAAILLDRIESVLADRQSHGAQ